MDEKEYYTALATGRLSEHLLLTYDYNSNSFVLINSSTEAKKRVRFITRETAKNLIVDHLKEIPKDNDLLRLPKAELTYNPKLAFGIISGAREINGFNLFNTHNEPNFDIRNYQVEKVELEYNLHSLFLNLFENNDGLLYALKWLAYMVQRNRNETSLLLFGIEGAGKGLFFNLIKRLLGETNVANIENTTLESQFNEEMMDRRLLFFNEMNTYGKNQHIGNKLKTYISDNYLTIYPKGKTPFTITNHSNIIIATNSDNAIKVTTTDRRFSVFKQKKKLSKDIADKIVNLSDVEIIKLKEMLFNYPLDNYNPRTPFENETRTQLMMNTATKKEYLIHLVKNEKRELKTLIDELFNRDGDNNVDYSSLVNDNFYRSVISRTFFEKVQPDLAEITINSDYKLLQEKNVLTSRLAITFYRIAIEDLKSSTTAIGRFYSKYFGKSKVIKIAKDKTTKAYSLESE